MRIGHLLLAGTLLIGALAGLPMAFAAEENPGETTQRSKSSRPPEKIEYDKLPYATLQRKADAGDLEAQFELGSRQNYGRDLPKNTREALRWLRKAAQRGHPEAQRLLAVKLFEGHDVPVDHEEAFRWTQRLANTGDRPGQFTLGTLYANGEGTSRDLIRAYMWFDIAATPLTGKEMGDTDKQAMEAAAKARDNTASLLMPEEEVEAQQLASDWWRIKNAARRLPTPPKNKAEKPAKDKPSANSAS